MLPHRDRGKEKMEAATLFYCYIFSSLGFRDYIGINGKKMEGTKTMEMKMETTISVLMF